MKRIISCSITGSIHVPTMSEYLPITVDEIANSALEAAEAGAAVVHLHARDEKTGKPSPDLELFKRIIDRIREKNKEVVICLTTGGSLDMTVDQRVAVVPKFRPELASINAGSINWGLFPLAERIKDFKHDWERPYYENTKDAIFKNTFADMERILQIMDENEVTPEIECYDVGHIYNVKYFLDRGMIKGKPYLQFVLGINGALGASPEDVMMMKQTADRVLGVGNYNWSAFGAGRNEYPVCIMNLFLGGHVRVGLEDNLNLGKGVKAKSNAELVSKMVKFMEMLDYEVASPAEAREILGLRKV